MEFVGHVQNGVVVFDGPTPPEGATVRVRSATGDQSRSTEESKPQSLLDILGDLVGKAEGLPADAATNVDHYLYGAPKR